MWAASKSEVISCFFLDAIEFPSTYTCQSVGEWVRALQWVIHSFRFGDSYCISELCELVSVSEDCMAWHGMAWYEAQSIICFALVFAPSPSHPSSVAPRQRRLFCHHSDILHFSNKPPIVDQLFLPTPKEIYSKNLCLAANRYAEKVKKMNCMYIHIKVLQ